MFCGSCHHFSRFPRGGMMSILYSTSKGIGERQALSSLTGNLTSPKTPPGLYPDFSDKLGQVLPDKKQSLLFNFSSFSEDKENTKPQATAAKDSVLKAPFPNHDSSVSRLFSALYSFLPFITFLNGSAAHIPLFPPILFQRAPFGWDIPKDNICNFHNGFQQKRKNRNPTWRAEEDRNR